MKLKELKQRSLFDLPCFLLDGYCKVIINYKVTLIFKFMKTTKQLQLLNTVVNNNANQGIHTFSSNNEAVWALLMMV